MNSENFCYWLNGWLEIENPAQINSKQLNEIRNHLNLSLNKKSENSSLSLSGLLNNPDLTNTYLTITQKPIWDKGDYEAYYDNKTICNNVNQNFGLNLVPEKLKIVIDNELKPKVSTWCKPITTTGVTNHMIGLPVSDDTMGIINIGTGPTLYC